MIHGKGVCDIPNARSKYKQQHSAWRNMFKRCYCQAWVEKRPSYLGCTVDERWWKFSEFKLWMDAQDYYGKQLDKDILGDGKLYSPETCCFVSARINGLVTNHTGSGVCFDVYHQKWKAQIRNGKGSLKTLLMHKDKELVQSVFNEAKIKLVLNLIQDLPQNIQQGIINKVLKPLC